MALTILGIGMVSALGCGIEAFQAGLEGRAWPAIEMHTIETAAGPAPLPVYTARPEGLDRFVTKRAQRRLDSFTRMALLASYLAVEDARFQPPNLARVGIVFGSGYGPLQTTFQFQDGILDFGDKCASPTAFASSVHNAPAAQVSIAMGIEGPCQTLTCFEHTAPGVLLTALAWLGEGIVDYVLAGVGEEYCPLGGYGAKSLGSEAGAGVEPLNFGHCTWSPGEGFVAFLLGRAAEARSPYGRIEEIAFIRDGADDPQAILARLEPCHALCLAASGSLKPGAGYQALCASGKPCAAHASLYGSMPVGLGFELAAAALALKQGVLYASASMPRAAAPLPEAARLACVECTSPGEYTVLSLSR